MFHSSWGFTFYDFSHCYFPIYDNPRTLLYSSLLTRCSFTYIYFNTFTWDAVPKVARSKITPARSAVLLDYLLDFLIFSRKNLITSLAPCIYIFALLPCASSSVSRLSKEKGITRIVPRYRYILRSTKRLAEVKRRIAWLAMGHLIRPESRGKEVRSASKVLGTYPPLVCASLKTRRHRGKGKGRSYRIQEEEIGGRRASIVILVNYSH